MVLKGYSFGFFNIKTQYQNKMNIKYMDIEDYKKIGSYYYYIYLDPDNKTDMIINKKH